MSLDVRTGDGLGDRSRSCRSGLQPQRSGDLAVDPRGRLSGRPLRSLPRHVGAVDPRVRRRDRLRHRALHQPRRRGQPRDDGRLSRRARSAGRRRSPATRRSTTTPVGSSCRRSRPRRSSAGSRRSAACAPSLAAAIVDRGDAVVRRLAALRPTHPRQRDRSDARSPAGGRRPVPPVRAQRPRSRRRPDRRADRLQRRARRLPRRAHRRARRRTGRRPDLLPARRRAVR